MKNQINISWWKKVTTKIAARLQKPAFSKAVTISGAGVTTLGLLALFGWIIGTTFLTSISSAYIPMAPDTALVFTMFGLILIFYHRIQKRRSMKVVTSVSIVVVSIYGVLKFIELFLNIDLTFANILFSTTETIDSYLIKRMSPITGLMFFLSGITLLLKLLVETRYKIYNIVSSIGLTIMIIGFIATVGYAFGTPMLYGGNIIPLAATTAIGFLLLGFGLLALAGANNVFVQLFVGDSAKAQLLRVFIPLTIVSLLIQGILEENIDVIFGSNHALATALFSLVFAAFMSGVVVQFFKVFFQRIEKAEIEEKQARNELILSEERFRAIVENVGEGIGFVNSEEQFVFANSAAAEIFGVAPGKLTGMNLNHFVSPAQFKVVQKETSQRIQGNKSVYELEIAGSNGEQRNIIVTAVPWFDNEKCFLGSYGVFRDITQRKRVEEEIRKSKEAFQGYFEMGSIGMCITSPEKGWIEVNDRLCQMLGYNKNEFSQRTWAELTYAEDLNADLELFNEILEGKRNSYQLDKRFVHKDGNIIYTSLSVSCLRKTDGTVDHFLASLLDITERKLTEIALKESEEKYRQLYESNQMPIAIFDTENLRFLSVNNAFVHTYGYTREEFLTMTILEIRPESEIPRVQHSVKMNDKGLVNLGEYLHKKKNGEIIHVEIIRYDLIYNGKQAKLVFANDITERKQADEEIRKSKEDFKSYFDMGSMGMCITSPEKGWIEVNERLCQMLGYNKHELSQRNWAELTHPDDLNADLELFNEVLQGKRNSYELDKRFICKDGNIVYTALSVTCQRNTDGTVDHILASLLDITERKQTEKALSLTRLSIESASDSLFWMNPNGKIVDVNEAACRSLGYSREELLQLSVPDVDAHYNAEVWEQHFPELRKHGSLKFESEQRAKDGRIFPVEISANYVQRGSEEYNCAFVRDISERRQTEEALQKSETHYRTLFDKATDGIMFLSVDSKITKVNESFAKMHGYTVDEMKNMNLRDLDTPETSRAVSERLSRLFSGETLIFEVEHYHKDGHTIQLEVSANLTTSGSENIIQSFHRDITERKRVEEELRESEDKYRGVVENSPNAIAIYVDGKIVFVNSQCVVLMAAANKEDLIGKSVVQFVHPDNRAMVIERMKQVSIDGKPLPTAEEKFIRFDGTSVDVEVRAVPTSYKRKTAVQLIVQDITERKKAEKALHLSEQTYRGIMDSITEAVYVEDANGIFLDVNRAAEKMYGYTKEEFVGRTPEFLSAPGKNDLSQLAPLLEKALNGEPQYFEFWGRRKDGTIFPKDVSNSLGYYFGEKVNIAVARDITERKNAEQALRQAQKLESIGTLAGGIAHDFNNLMNAVLGQSSLALNKLPKESPAADNIQKAIKAGERVADLTKQLLAYSGRGKFFIVEIDLNTLVTENVQMLEASIPKTTQLRYELGNPSPHIMGDISQIQQVIMNLIINAGEAIGSIPGFITVSTNRIEILTETNEYSKYTSTLLAAGSYAIIQVEDSGSGISEETLTRIFDPFFTTKFTGRGLGLAAVLGIIKGHKGGLRIESKIGKRTTFEIIFPLIVPSKTTKVSEKKELPAANGKGKTILVIDDEASVIELLEDMLPEINIKVISALDPLKGIEIYRRDHQNISLVVLDYSMPNMDGKAAFEELIKINKDVKVLLCSGYSEEETMSVFELDRPTGYFQKPYNTEDLVQRVGEIVSKES